MAKVIAVYNKKGGCGKTTTATTLAYLLARCGKRTALIDLDSQGDSSLAYGVPNPDKLQTTILSLVKQVIIGEPLPSPSSYMYSYHGVDLVPSNEEISTLERNLSNVDFREYILKEYISQISPSYDYIIIDCIIQHQRIQVRRIFRCLSRKGSVRKSAKLCCRYGSDNQHEIVCIQQL